MSRWLPRSIFSRMVLVLLGGLAIAQLASFSVYWHDRDEFMQRVMGLRAVQRIADITRLFDTMTPAERRRIVGIVATPALRITLDAAPLAPAAEADPAQTEQAALFSSAVRSMLGPDVAVAVQVIDAPVPHGPDDSHAFRPRAMGGGPGMMGGGPGIMDRGFYGPGMGYPPSGPSFIVQTRLKDGSLVTFDTRRVSEMVKWPDRLLLSLAILLIAVTTLTLLAARWVTRPLKTLAVAAERLGEDIDRPPLDETGPLEVRRAAHAFNTMQQRLARFIQDRTRIFAAMSHDLKTPITRLRLRAELLDDAELRTKFEKDLQEMEEMVRATLDFMRGLEGGERCQPLDVMALLQSLQEDADELHGKVQVAGSASTPYPGRLQSLKRCLANLIENALKYGGSAAITVEDSPDKLTIRIRDEGPGMPETELERAFEPFYRLEASRSRATGGTGLGLTIARSIARAHGGEVTLRNHPQGGLEAVLTLPRAVKRPSARERHRPAPARSG